VSGFDYGRDFIREFDGKAALTIGKINVHGSECNPRRSEGKEGVASRESEAATDEACDWFFQR
jgi:hypothetical protein